MKLLDYFNIFFIIFVLLCVFFVINNEYKLNILERYESDPYKCAPFELAHSCIYRIVNRLSNGNSYSLCQIRVIDLDLPKEEQDNEIHIFYMFDKFDSTDIYSCIKHRVRYSEEEIKGPITIDIKYSVKSDLENLEQEEDINKIIYKLLETFEGPEKLPKLMLEKTYSFQFEKEIDEFEDGEASLRNIKTKIIGSSNKIIEYDNISQFKIFDNSTKKQETDSNKEYVILINTEPDKKLINKNGYREGNLHKDNIKDNQNSIDYYENLGILFLTQENICQLKNDSILIKEKNDGKIVIDESNNYFENYDKTSQKKEDYMCPKDIPYPYDTFIDNKKNFKFKYRYDIVESRNMCCENIPEAKKNEDLDGLTEETKEDEYNESDNFEDEEDDTFYSNSDENEPIYMICNGKNKKCEDGGKCNMYDIQKNMCIPKSYENEIIDSKNIKSLDDILNDENEKLESNLFERMSFEIIKYYNTSVDSSKGTYNLMESKL